MRESRRGLEYYRGQLKEFREDDEARWRYEAEEAERQLNALKGIGRSNEATRAELQRAGINVSMLEQESRAAAEREARAHRELLRIQPPPVRRGAKEQILIQQAAARARSHTWLYPPAYEAWGNAET